MDIGAFREKLRALSLKPLDADGAGYLGLLDCVMPLLEHAPDCVRPRDSAGVSGGLLRIPGGLPVILIPDLHARPDFLLDALDAPVLTGGKTLLAGLADSSAAALCLGDGFHSERRAIGRWLAAWDEYGRGNAESPQMEEEMRESIGTMELVMECIVAFPSRFFFLKGNHENILNEEGNGNYPFRKFAAEGAMVRDFVIARYGTGFLDRWARFERALPLFAAGGRFLASHAEPSRPYSAGEIINAREHPGTVEGLTWTDNGRAEEGSVARMLDLFLPGRSDARYFGGHRAVSGTHALRADGRFIQLHNPDSPSIALVPPDRAFDCGRDIHALPRVRADGDVSPKE